MKVGWQEIAGRIRWELRFRLAAASPRQKYCCCAAIFMLSAVLFLIVSIESDAHNVQQHLAAAKAVRAESDNEIAPARSLPKLLAQFHDFLPARQELPAMVSSLHSLARESGLNITSMTTQPLSVSEGATYAGYSIRLQLTGEQKETEHFVLLALHTHDSLVLRRWSFQEGNNPSSISSIDLHYLVKP
ncbi:type 4a pilus biogenesis protein PilO [Halopseudomonas sabulinigri]|uniref:Uncharacterized protein n=1 Tax=Halopseudomonas sabulinigri TaxID=472181 RepID=A0ABP9ZUQ7_9GAMM